MFRATITRGGKWSNNLYSEDKVYGDFQVLKGATEWIATESKEFRGGWPVTRIVIEEKTSESS